MERNGFTRRRFLAAAATGSLAALGLSTLPAFGDPAYVTHNAGSHHPMATRQKSVLRELQSWVEIQNSVYGAMPDHHGPIGGGAGYSQTITKGDYTIENVDA